MFELIAIAEYAQTVAETEAEALDETLTDLDATLATVQAEVAHAATLDRPSKSQALEICDRLIRDAATLRRVLQGTKAQRPG